MMRPQAKECPGPRESRRGKEGFFSSVSGGGPALMTPWFWASGLQNCESIKFVDLSHQVCGTWLRQPQDTNTDALPSWLGWAGNVTRTLSEGSV